MTENDANWLVKAIDDLKDGIKSDLLHLKAETLAEIRSDLEERLQSILAQQDADAKPVCEKCAHFRDCGDVGYCHRNGPSYGEHGRAVWPRVGRYSGCGEFRARYLEKENAA